MVTDTYYERKSKYDPEKKYYVTFHSVLLGRMKQGSQDRYDLLPTRPKVKSERTVPQSLAALRNAAGMIDIVRHMEKLSGIGKEITAAMPDAPGLSAKTRTLVWYAFATDGDTWPGIKAWSLRYNGLLPYADTCFSNDMYHDVFVSLGRNEEIRQAIFKMRAQGLGDEELIALDSATIETFSQRGGKKRKSIHKDRLVKKVYKIVYFYSIDQRRPTAYAIIPGNITDSMTLPNALKQLESLSLKKAELVYDNGYCTDGTLYTMLKENSHFITRIEADIHWTSGLIDNNREELEHGGEIIECDPKFSGKKLSVEHTFRSRKGRGSEEAGGSITRKINVFIYFSSMNKARDDVYFREMFNSW